MAFCGSLLTSIHDANNSSDDNEEQDGDERFQSQLWGDIAGIISAGGE